MRICGRTSSQPRCAQSVASRKRRSRILANNANAASADSEQASDEDVADENANADADTDTDTEGDAAVAEHESSDDGSGDALPEIKTEIEATDPAAVQLAAGQPQLVEFFAFW